jgi:adenylosuccinate lyase
MRANLERTGGLFFSEAVLLRLVHNGLARQRAYEMVQRCALAAHSGDDEFRALLAADPDIGEHLSDDELASAFDLEHHLRHVDFIYRRVFPDE